MELRDWIMLITFAGTAISTWAISAMGWRKLAKKDKEAADREAEKIANNIVLDLRNAPLRPKRAVIERLSQGWFTYKKPSILYLRKKDLIYTDRSGERPYDGTVGNLKLKNDQVLYQQGVDMFHPKDRDALVMVAILELKNAGTGAAFSIKLSGVSIIGATEIESLEPQSTAHIVVAFDNPDDDISFFFSRTLTISYVLSNKKRITVAKMIQP